MKEFKILRFLDLFRRLFAKMGIDYSQMRNILRVKLTMDARRVPTVFANQKFKKERNMFLSSLWMNLLYGVICIPFVVLGESLMYQMSIVFGLLFFFIMTSMISDFSSVLLDIREKTIIASKPVSPRTYHMAKIIHVLIYLFFLTISLAGPSLLVSIFVHGVLFFLIFLGEIVLLDIAIIVFTSFFYLTILKFFNGEKLKDFINYFQIILSFMVIVCYQLLGRVFEVIDFNLVFKPQWWQFLIIPIWFGGPFEVFIAQNTDPYFIVFSLLALIVPLLGFFIYLKMIPVFEINMQKLASEESRKKPRPAKVHFLTKLICPKKEERCFYRFTTQMMKKERNFKLRAYPFLGFSIIIPFIIILNFLRENNLEAIRDTKHYLWIYMTAFIIPTIFSLLMHSKMYKAAWIYKAAPIEDLSAVMKGMFKAFFVGMVFPIYVFQSILFLLLFGFRIWLDLIVVFLIIILFAMFNLMLSEKGLPFSKSDENIKRKSGKLNLFLLLVGICAAGHFGFTFIPYGIPIYVCIAILLIVLLWNRSFRVSWDKIQDSY